MSNDGFAAQRKKIIDDLVKMIEADKFAIMGVSGGENTPPFMYTIGLSAIGLMDFVVFGLSGQAGAGLIHNVVAKMKEVQANNGGHYTTPISFGKDLDIANVPIALIPIKDRPGNEIYFTFSRIIHTERLGKDIIDWKCAQLVWSDTNGVLPWEAGFEDRFKEKQLELYTPVDLRAICCATVH